MFLPREKFVSSSALSLPVKLHVSSMNVSLELPTVPRYPTDTNNRENRSSRLVPTESTVPVYIPGGTSGQLFQNKSPCTAQSVCVVLSKSLSLRLKSIIIAKRRINIKSIVVSCWVEVLVCKRKNHFRKSLMIYRVHFLTTDDPHRSDFLFLETYSLL